MNEQNDAFDSDSGPQYTQEPMDQASYGDGGQFSEDYGSGKGKGQGMGIASMVCGILSIVMICLPYGPIILGIVGVALGIAQIVKNESKGMAIAGIVCGIIGTVDYIILLVIGMMMLEAAGGDINQLIRQLEDAGLIISQ